MDFTVAVDSIEFGIARLETDDKKHLLLPTECLPAGVHEGDVLRLSATHEGSSAKIVIEHDPEAQSERSRKARAKLNRLRKRQNRDQ